jgi:LCP family protein required for cell wall assembly
MSRRSLTAAAVALALTAAGCSGDSEPKAGPTTTSATTTATPTTPTPPPLTVTGKGLPKDLLATMRVVYLGGKAPATGDVAGYVAKRKPVKKDVALTGSTGSWKGTPIAAVGHGKDVTLLVKNKKTWTIVGGWWPSLGLKQRVPTKPMRVLAIGSDARPQQRVDGQRADALHIIGVDGKGVGGIVGIPRDSWVPLASGGSGKVNAALAFGGAKGQTRTVQNATGVPIDGYVMTGFKGFRAMVNSMGGIKFVASSAMKSSHGTTLLKKGVNILRGEPALNVARERKTLPNGDFGRSANQGRLILAGMAMAGSGGPTTLPRYLTKMSPHIHTDLSAAQILNLSAAALVSSPGKVPNKVAPGGVGTRSGQSVVLLGGGAQSLFADIKDGRLGG